MGLQFTCSVKRLLTALRTVFPAISGRSSLPILNHFKLESQGDKLSIFGYDLEIQIRQVFGDEVEIEAEGALVLPGKFLLDLLAKLPGGERVRIKAEKTHSLLTCGKSKYKIPMLPAEEYRAPVHVGEGAVCTVIQQERLKALFTHTLFAAGEDQVRPIITGVHLAREEVDGTVMLRAVTTDTHRLSLYETPVEIEPVAVILIHRFAALCTSVLSETAPERATLLIGTTCASLLLQNGNLELTGRLIVGTFPNYKRLVPATCNSKVSLHKEVFLEAATRARLVGRDDAERICLDIFEDHLYLSSQTQYEKAEEEFSAVVEGDRINTACNGKYLIQALENMAGSHLTLEMIGGLKPLLLRPVGTPDGDHHLQILMPMQRD